MSSSHDTGRKSAETPTGKAGKGGGGKQQSRTHDMGSALRTVYQQTVEENVPDEMMDLLGKLG